jgi:hypothetical protein
MSRPAESSSGPLELPGLIAGSVWITLPISLPPLVGNRRFSALMMPLGGMPVTSCVPSGVRSDHLTGCATAEICVVHAPVVAQQGAGPACND